VIFQQEMVGKIKLWSGLTKFGRGLFIILLGILTKSAGSLVKEDTFSLLLTTIGVIAFFIGLYIALVGMDGQFKGFKRSAVWGEKRR